MIPFFLRHYEPLVERMFIFDNGSTDRSRELLKQSKKVELGQFDRGDSFNLTHNILTNSCWKQSRGRADWVMIVDIDEFLYHPRLLDYLAECQQSGVTIIHPRGMEMVSADFPHRVCDLPRTVRRGVPSHYMDKLAAFNPDAIDEINYGPGRHTTAPQGRVVYPPKRETKLLHYKHLGSEYFVARMSELRGRRTALDREMGFSIHLERSDEQLRADFVTMLAAANEVIEADSRRRKFCWRVRSLG